jgi:hypothetical protein
MRATKIKEQEIKFSQKLTNTSNVKYTDNGTEKIGNSTIRKIRPSFDSYYYKTEHKKDLIVIHSTVGTLCADMASLTNKDTNVNNISGNNLNTINTQENINQNKRTVKVLLFY